MVDKGEPDPVTRVRTVQKPVYYVSEVLHEAKARYLETHKLIYAILMRPGNLTSCYCSGNLTDVSSV